MATQLHCDTDAVSQHFCAAVECRYCAAAEWSLLWQDWSACSQARTATAGTGEGPCPVQGADGRMVNRMEDGAKNGIKPSRGFRWKMLDKDVNMLQLVVPWAPRAQVLWKGHNGVTNILQGLQRCFYWKWCRQDWCAAMGSSAICHGTSTFSTLRTRLLCGSVGQRGKNVATGNSEWVATCRHGGLLCQTGGSCTDQQKKRPAFVPLSRTDWPAIPSCRQPPNGPAVPPECLQSASR